MNNNATQEEELKKELEETQLLVEMMGHPGWKIFMKDFTEYVGGLNTIRELDFKHFGIEEGMARQLAINMLEVWINREIGKAGRIEDLVRQLENRNKTSDLYKIHE